MRYSRQCFDKNDTVGWVTGTAFSKYTRFASTFPKILLLVAMDKNFSWFSIMNTACNKQTLVRKD